MNRPLFWVGGAQAIEGQVGTLTDAHTRVPHQQKGITPEVVAAEELLLQELILLGGERPWEPVRSTRNILTADQMGEFGKLFGPSEFIAEGT